MFVSLRYKLGLALFLGVFLVVLVILAFQQYYAFVQLREYVKSSAQTSVQVAIELSDKWYINKMKTAQVMAYGVKKALLTPGNLETEFLQFVKDNELKDAYLGLENGTYIDALGWKPGDAYNFKLRPWYRQAKSTQKPSFIPPYVDARTGEYTISFAAPVFDINNWRVVGVVAFDVLLHELELIIGSIFMTEVDRLDVIEMGEGEIQLVVKSKDINENSYKSLIASIKKGEKGNDGVVIVNAARYMLVEEHLNTADISVLYPISLQALITPILKQALVYFLATVVGLWAIACFGWAIIGKFVSRIEDLNESTKRISSGDFDIQVKKNSRDEIGQLAESFNRMIVSIKDYIKKLEITVREKEAISKELELASELQKRALPKSTPNVNGLEIVACSIPAKAVGGDYYDFLYPEQTKVGFVIADAAGKGFPGSLYMSNSRSIFRTVSAEERSPAQMLIKTNDHITRDSGDEGMFITYIYGVYDLASRTFIYSNAGHFPPMHYSPSQKVFKQLDASGMPLGIMSGEVYTEESVQMAKDDILVMYTDGVIEAHDHSGKMYSFERLQKMVQKHASLSANLLLDQIRLDIEDFVGAETQFDDITMVVIKATL